LCINRQSQDLPLLTAHLIIYYEACASDLAQFLLGDVNDAAVAVVHSNNHAEI
jgi:hypothetical protein